MGYDEWLERPYQDLMEEGERFNDWAEEFGFNLDDEVDHRKAAKAYEAYLEGQYEDEAEAKYEAYIDRMEYEAHEIDDYFDESW